MSRGRVSPTDNPDFQAEASPLKVNQSVSIPRGELVVRATRAGGPGGQHVNKTATRIELLWNVLHSAALGEPERQRALERLASRLDADGWLRIVVSDTRSQLRNRRLAEERLVSAVRASLVKPRARKPTAPPARSRAERLHDKRLQSEKKRRRRNPASESDD